MRRILSLSGSKKIQAVRLVERLESRWLLAFTSLSGTELTVTGTIDNDLIDLHVQGADLVVTLNSQSESVPAAGLTRITIDALAGHDQIALEAGVIGTGVNGGEGNDTLVSGPGDDTLVGGGGNDVFVFFNDWGHDVISEAAGAGTDTVDFSAVTDNLQFSIGALAINDGTNTVNHGENNIENLIGGQGNDSYIFQIGATLSGTITDASGTDGLAYGLYTTAVTVNLATGAATGTTGVSGIENVIGGSANDTLTGDSQVNILDGGGGANTLNGGGGNDVFTASGSTGTNTITSAPGEGSLDFSSLTVPLIFTISTTTVTVKDGSRVVATGGIGLASLIGGQGNDRFVFAKNATFAGTVDGGSGVNTLDYRKYTTVVKVRLDHGTATAIGGVSHIQNVFGGAANDVLVGDGLTNRLYGYGGNDNILGLGGNDLLRGGAGNDILRGGAGNDNLYGDAGNDKLYGDAGNDKVYGGLDNDSLIGGAGSDLLSGSLGNDAFFAKDSARDTLVGGGGNDRAERDGTLDVLKDL